MMESIASIGIVGAGVKGAEIATCALLGGYRVFLEDVSSARLAEGCARISAALHEAIGASRVPESSQAIRRLVTAQSIADVSRTADLLVEAAPEDAELQLEVFTIFDKFAMPRAILAAAGDSVPVSGLAEMTNRPERCVGLHFFGLPRNGRVQIVRARCTDAETAETCVRFARRMNLEPLIITEPSNASIFSREPHRL